MDTAVPLGLIVDELVSNSLKHAFPEKQIGEIKIKLCRKAAGKKKNNPGNIPYLLTVSDNGIGIPEDFDVENSETLGLQLIILLAEQLEGELVLRRV
jgi:two-component sensor histidine kinase